MFANDSVAEDVAHSSAKKGFLAYYANRDRLPRGCGTQPRETSPMDTASTFESGGLDWRE